ncbi:hypothetical protein SK571_13575 [Lentzea sp. BCCO 10_0798]|uniref:Helix-turn-helix domain-containing protein n=1 Tax=Lentzea kristufekii TaxID=3095430 RepID=A0ABU4TRF6_9PSEU|nr:hypothetical protein [Lentzea sp. BCCO 10_0798]MDX8050416.1 hypothetical protein [Lentzea sp. BCCO 10_0798]
MIKQRKRLADTEAVASFYDVAPGTVRSWASRYNWTPYGGRRARQWDLIEIEQKFREREMENSYSGEATLVWADGQAEVFVNLVTHGGGNELLSWSGHAEPTEDGRAFGAFGQGVEVRLPDGRSGKALGESYLEDGTLTLVGTGPAPYASSAARVQP